MSVVSFGLGLTATGGSGAVTQFIDGVVLVENIEVQVVSSPVEVAVRDQIDVEILDPVEVEVD